MKHLNLVLVATLCALLSSCEKSFDIRVMNASPFSLIVYSDEKIGRADPRQAVTMPFPSKASGSRLTIVGNNEMRCYRLGFDLDRKGKRRVLQHHVLQAFVDGQLQLHLPAANAGSPEEVVRGQPCMLRM